MRPVGKRLHSRSALCFMGPTRQPDSNVQMHVWSATGPKKMICQGNMAYISSFLAFTKNICALLTMTKPWKTLNSFAYRIATLAEAF